MVQLKQVKRKANPLEILSSEALSQIAENAEGKDFKINIMVDSGLIEINSKNYIVTDSDVMALVEKVISEKDCFRLMRLGSSLRAPYNLVASDNGVPFNTTKLADKLGINVENTNKFVKRMCDKGLMTYTNCTQRGVTGKIYAVNPQLIRRGKRYDREFVLNHFEIFDKDFKASMNLFQDTDVVSGMANSKLF